MIPRDVAVYVYAEIPATGKSCVFQVTVRGSVADVLEQLREAAAGFGEGATLVLREATPEEIAERTVLESPVMRLAEITPAELDDVADAVRVHAVTGREHRRRSAVLPYTSRRRR